MKKLDTTPGDIHPGYPSGDIHPGSPSWIPGGGGFNIIQYIYFFEHLCRPGDGPSGRDEIYDDIDTAVTHVTSTHRYVLLVYC